MPDVAERADVLTLDNFIGGRWVKTSTTEFFDVHNPAVGSVIGRTPLSTASDVDAAVRAASQAFPAWRDTPVNARAQVLYKFKALLEQHFEELARTVTTEHGKTLDEARGSVRRGIECVEVACGAPSLMQGFGLEDISAQAVVADYPRVRVRPRSGNRNHQNRSEVHHLSRHQEAGTTEALPTSSQRRTVASSSSPTSARLANGSMNGSTWRSSRRGALSGPMTPIAR